MMIKPESTGGRSSSSSSTSEAKYRGVRLRKWGKWVSEVRLPNSRDRIWLGSYDSPEKAARAFDAAAFCLHGNKAHLNFPHDPPPPIPNASSFTHKQIQQAAARHAHSYSYSRSYCYSSNYDKPATLAAADVATEEAASPETMSEGFSVEDVETTDWSFLNLMMSPAATDFSYDFLLTAASSGEEEVGVEEGGSTTFLSNFNNHSFPASFSCWEF